MTIERQLAGDVEVTVSVYRNGERLQNAQGAYDIYEYITGFEVYESITSATMEAKIIVEDSGGFLGAMTGSELFKIQIVGSIVDRTYYFRAYEIESRTRFNTSDSFIVNCVSDEFLKNEVTNVFGNSKVIFNDETEASKIINFILTNKDYLNTKKRFLSEETLNKQQFIATNWRPFDCIYWLAQRSIRKAEKGGTLQNGFLFYENSLGYNFKSIDGIIDSVNKQSLKDGQSVKNSTDFQSGQKTKLYNYVYTPTKIDNTSSDQFKIETIVFPEEKNFLSGLRHGTWSGFSIGFDPVTITSSKMGASTDMSADAYRYKLTDLWPKMSHIGEKKAINPVKQMDESIQAMIDYPKRVRYTMLPNQNFDPKFQQNPQSSYAELVELQAYQYLRIESLKTTKLMIQIPGNLDLYVGTGINVDIPATYKKGAKVELDKKYSGKYVVAALTHKVVNTTMTTEALLLKDSVV